VKKFLVFLTGLIMVFFLLESVLSFLSFFSDRSRSNKCLENNKKMIYCLGDSFTYGAGVASENSYPMQLNKRLSKKGYRVFNFGVLGGNTSDALKKLKQEIKEKGKPDIVTLMINEANTWNFDGSKKMSSSALSILKRFLNRFRTVRVFTLLEKYYFQKKNGIEEKYSSKASREDPVYLDKMKIINRNRYDSLFFDLKEKSCDIKEVKESIRFDKVVNKKDKLSALYYNIYYGDINSIIPLDENELENTPIDEIIARAIKAIYVKDLNTAFRNMEFLVNNADIRKEFYAISYYLFKEKDRREFLYEKGKEKVDIKGSLRENTKSLKNNIITLFDKYSNPIAYQDYIFRFIQSFSKDVNEDNDENKDLFILSLYNLLIRSSFSDKKLFNSFSILLNVAVVNITGYKNEYLELIERILGNVYLYENLKDYDCETVFKVTDKIIGSLKKESLNDKTLSSIYKYRFLNTENITNLKISFDYFFRLKEQDQIFNFNGIVVSNDTMDKVYEFLKEKPYLYKRTENKQVLSDVSHFFSEVGERLFLDYKYDKGLEMFHHAIKAADLSSMSKWEKAFLLVKRNGFKQILDKEDDSDIEEAINSIFESFNEIGNKDLKKFYMAESISRLKNQKKKDEYLQKMIKYLDKDENKDVFDDVERWVVDDVSNIIKICKINDIRLIMLGYPHFDNYLLRDLSKKNDLEYIDLFSFFQSLFKRNGIRPYILGDSHLSELGNRKVAELLEKEITR